MFSIYCFLSLPLCQMMELVLIEVFLRTCVSPRIKAAQQNSVTWIKERSRQNIMLTKVLMAEKKSMYGNSLDF